ncbi:MAG: hypothetical protein ABFD50_13920 [Smithella sp.]
MAEEKYTSYERVRKTLLHKEPDRIPFDLGATPVTGMNVHLYTRLRDALGLPKIEPNISDITQQLAFIDEDVRNILSIDVRGVPNDPPLNKGYEKPVEKDGKYYKRTDAWGIQWKMPVENGHYFDMVGHPFAKYTTVEDLEHFNWPDPFDEGRFATLKKRNEEVIFSEKKAVVIGSDPGIWELALWTNGFEKFFADMAAEKEYAHAVMR